MIKEQTMFTIEAKGNAEDVIAQACSEWKKEPIKGGLTVEIDCYSQTPDLDWDVCVSTFMEGFTGKLWEHEAQIMSMPINIRKSEDEKTVIRITTLEMPA